MDNFQRIRNFMAEQNLSYLLVNSTNEYLVEYNTLEQNSRYKLTNFSGSTGEALVTPDTIFLFVDGRYHIQADLEVNHEYVSVVKLQTGQKYLDELIKRIPQNEILGVFSKKNSQQKIEFLEKNLQLKLLDFDVLDEQKILKKENNIQLDIKYVGLSTEEKIKKLSQNLSDKEFLLITDLDEVSYLFNMRNFDNNFTAKIHAKALISKNKGEIFYPDKFETLYKILKDTSNTILVDKSSINAHDYSLVKDKVKVVTQSPVKLMKAQKNQAEISHLKEAFKATDRAVWAIRDYIYNNENLSEYDIATQLEKEFKKQGALGLSFNSIVARNENSALAHYSKSSKDEIIKEGDLVLIDCGAYFGGGLATDITRVFVKGKPTELQKKIYTIVLKAFLRAYNYKNPQNGFEIDNCVRKYFDELDLGGFVFNHGLGHGLGINVHEYPPNLSCNEIAKTPIKDGMCFSIEPGLYKEGFFGVRLENSCYFEGGKIHSFVKMNYEKKLIDFDMLTPQEQAWLMEFEVK